MTSARLASALAGAGCRVEAVCPSDHPVERVRAVGRVHRYRNVTPVRSLVKAIRSAQPTVLVPCDDLSLFYLHRLYERALAEGPALADVRAVVESSLGDARSYAIVASRSRLMELANRTGIAVPATSLARTIEELEGWLQGNGIPAVLKADANGIRRTVHIAHSEADARRAWNALAARPRIAWTLKRALVNREHHHLAPALMRACSAVAVQQYVPGHEANVSAVCWNGRVLAAVGARVLRTSEPQGPASALEVIDNGGMMAAVERLVGALGVSGVVGFDFIIGASDAAPYLIEMNPRATQTSHLRLGSGRDLPGALTTCLSKGETTRPCCATTSAIVALFPQEWLRDPASELLTSGYHDVPWEEPLLVREALRGDVRRKLWNIVRAGADRAQRIGAHLTTHAQAALHGGASQKPAKPLEGAK